MKTKRLTPLSPFSKRGSKKIELALLFLLLTPLTPGSQTLELSVESYPEQSAVLLDCVVSGAPEDELWESVEEGFQVEVAYTVRLYRTNTGLFRFLGDRIVEDAEPSRIGEYDPFTKLYLIHDTATGRTIRADNRDSFLSQLLRIRDIRFELPREEGAYYLLAGAEISPVKLKPPLTILAVFSKKNRYQTDFHRVDIPEKGAAP